jgi:membrane-bound lytic murein transglycosylase D
MKSLNYTSAVTRPTLVEAVKEAAPSKKKATVVASLERTPKSRVAPGGLDAGLEHERITYWVDKFSTSLSSGFERSLVRMSKYADMITAKLDAKKAPRDLIYLAMIESQFNPKAQSPVHAVGMWQFMSETAKRFGLKVGKQLDERKNPARATDAAIAYLSHLHDRFGSWYLAAAAYNSGEGTVQRALQRVLGRKTGTDADFFKILPVLPRETQDYVPKLIASARVGNAPKAYGLSVAGH